MRRRLFIGCAAFLLCGYQSIYGLTWENMFLVSQSREENVPRPGARLVVRGAPVDVFAILQANDNGRRLYYGKASRIRVGTTQQPVHPIPGTFKLEWFKVEPVMMHSVGEGHDPANPDFLWYTNAGAPGGRTDRQSLPPDRIHYKETALDSFRDQWSIPADAHPTEAVYDHYQGLGTMRYSAKVTLPDGTELRSPGMASYHDLGIGNDVWRITVIAEDTYLGHLSGYFNVPGVFGSYPTQVDRYVGVDCADLIVGGWNRFRGSKIPYTNVTGLRYSFVSEGRLKVVVKEQYLMGSRIAKGWDPAKAVLREPAVIPIDAQHVHVGDVIVFNYNADLRDKSWDHVGVLYADSGPAGKPDGILDAEDLILHAGPAEAKLSALGSSSFSMTEAPTRFAVVRWVF